MAIGIALGRPAKGTVERLVFLNPKFPLDEAAEVCGSIDVLRMKQ